MDAGKPDKKIIQVGEDDVTDDMLVVKLVYSDPIVDILFNRLKKIC